MHLWGFKMDKEYQELKEALETNLELTRQLIVYNNQMAGTRFMMIMTIVILIIIMVKVMGWI